MKISSLETLLQLGFAGAMAFVLVFIIWKIGNKTIETFKEISDNHTTTIKELQQEHKKERDQCYSSQAKRFDSFDETIKMMAVKFDCRHKSRG